MAGQAYEAGGIRRTVRLTREASDDELLANARRLIAEARAQGTTTIEIKSGYGLTRRRRGARAAARGDPHRRGDVPRRARRARRHRARRVRRPGVRRDARRLRSARELDRRVLRDRRVHGRRVAPHPGGRCRRGARAAHARRPARPVARGDRARRRARGGLHRPLHLPDRRRRRCARRVVDGRHPAAGRRVLDPAPVSRCPPASGCRGHRRARLRLQSGLELHDVDAVLRGRRRARHGHDAGRGPARRHARRSRGPAPRRHRAPAGRRACRPRGARRPHLRAPRVPPRRAARAPGASGAARHGDDQRRRQARQGVARGGVEGAQRRRDACGSAPRRGRACSAPSTS